MGECLGWRRPGGGGGSRLEREGQEEAEMPPLPGNKPFPSLQSFVSGKMHLIPLIPGSKCNGSSCELISMFHIHFPRVHQLEFIQMEINFVISLMLWPS